MGFRSESVTVPWRGRRKTGEVCRVTATMPQATKRSSPCLQPIPLIREECRLLKERSGIAIDDDAWAEIEETAEFRRPLRGRIPGRCRHFPREYRCVAALPSFQRFRILESIRNLRRRGRDERRRNNLRQGAGTARNEGDDHPRPDWSGSSARSSSSTGTTPRDRVDSSAPGPTSGSAMPSVRRGVSGPHRAARRLDDAFSTPALALGRGRDFSME